MLGKNSGSKTTRSIPMQFWKNSNQVGGNQNLKARPAVYLDFIWQD
jgi:hypothetical protein